MQVFFLSGLGADKTVFQLLDLSYCEPVFIDWLPPEKNESLQNYALRLKDKFIPDDATIIGLSFGGMLATEIAKQFPSVKPILISSAKTKSELPRIYATGKFFPLHQWSPHNLQKWFMQRIYRIFGINSKKVLKIYEEIIRNSNPAFNIWAVDAILNWNNSDVPNNIVHIHGTHDLVLPYKYIQCNYAVKKGGHLMIMEQAEILSEFLHKVITSNEINFSTLSSSDNQSALRYPA